MLVDIKAVTQCMVVSSLFRARLPINPNAADGQKYLVLSPRLSVAADGERYAASVVGEVVI
jgi:hypothetical protein